MERAARGALGVLAVALLGCLPGCVQKSASLQKSIAPPDKTLFETGENYLKRGQYIKSRLAFQTLLNTYPDSDMASEAYFSMGDSFYEEGGTENLLQAEDQYKNFIVFYPGDPKSDDAQMKIISLNYKMMRSPDRDPQYAHRTLEEIEVLERKYPNSDFLPIARQLKVGVEDNLARGDLSVGEFYLKRKNPLGARLRFQEVVDKYKDFEEMDRVLFRLGELYDLVQNPEAAIYYTKVVEGYPFSEYYEDAKARLTELGQNIPEVNQDLAAANQAKIRPDAGFSPLKPLVDFGKALGFIAPPDQYAVAQKTIADEKAAAAKEAAAGAGEDILIESEIRKSASGAATDESSPAGATTGGAGEVATPDGASGDGETPRKPSRYQRKPAR
ncbi:MAG: outer membrane protein assembly factor BamD [Acidobacteriota bacterium]|nr:outer membrane protein assembly factor BamD [Acidobacteriota bacterium]